MNKRFLKLKQTMKQTNWKSLMRSKVKYIWMLGIFAVAIVSIFNGDISLGIWQFIALSYIILFYTQEKMLDNYKKDYNKLADEFQKLNKFAKDLISQGLNNYHMHMEQHDDGEDELVFVHDGDTNEKKKKKKIVN